jgi:hypothetical protein
VTSSPRGATESSPGLRASAASRPTRWRVATAFVSRV